MKDEPSYLAFARQNVQDNQPTSPVLVRALLERIDRDAMQLEYLRNLTTRLH